jgi:ABC-type transporter MlaC component
LSTITLPLIDNFQYAVILIVLLILQIVLGALAFVAIKNDDGELNKQVTTAVKKVFDDYVKHNTNEDKQKVIDEIQKDVSRHRLE